VVVIGLTVLLTLAWIDGGRRPVRLIEVRVTISGVDE
jgi:hypothetical protein